MRYVNRLIAALTGCATLCIAAATVAYARPDPGGGVSVYPPSETSVSSAGTSLWETVALVGLGALLAIAVVGLAYSLRHRRKQGRRGSRSRHTVRAPEPRRARLKPRCTGGARAAPPVLAAEDIDSGGGPLPDEANVDVVNDWLVFVHENHGSAPTRS